MRPSYPGGRNHPSDVMSPDLLGHIANLAFAAAYLVRDMARLRVLSICGCLLCAAFQYAAPATPLWTGIGWNLFFATTNTICLARNKNAPTAEPA